MYTAPMVTLLVGIVLFLLGLGMSLRLRRRGNTRVMGRPWLAAVITGSLGGSLITLATLSLFLGVQP